MPLPANAKVIFEFLTSHGYSRNAAAGILGNMEQESGGNPESAGSGGNGLIGFTPARPGYVTGNVQKDLQTQLRAVLAYDNANGNVGALNKEPTAVQAAIYYMSKFERPAVATENQANRTSSARAVIDAANSGNWSGSGSTLGQNNSSGSSGGDIFSGIGGDLLSGIVDKIIPGGDIVDLIERGFLVLLGITFIIIGIIKITHGPDIGNPYSQTKKAKRTARSDVDSESEGAESDAEDYTDKPYKSEAGKRQYEEHVDRETEKAYRKGQRRGHLAEDHATESGEAISGLRGGVKKSGAVKALASEVPF